MKLIRLERWFDMKWVFMIFLVSVIIVGGFGYQTSKYDNCKSDLQALQSSYSELQTTKQEAQNSLTACTVSNQTLQADHDKAVGELADWKNRAEDAQRDAEVMKRQVEDLQAALSGKEAEIAGKDQALLEAQDKLIKAEQTVFELQAQVDRLEKDAVTSQQQSANTGKTVSSLEAEIAALNMEIETLRRERRWPPIVRLIFMSLSHEADANSAHSLQ